MEEAQEVSAGAIHPEVKRILALSRELVDAEDYEGANKVLDEIFTIQPGTILVLEDGYWVVDSDPDAQTKMMVRRVELLNYVLETLQTLPGELTPLQKTAIACTEKAIDEARETWRQSKP